MSAELTNHLAELEQEAITLQGKLNAVSEEIRSVRLQLAERTYGVRLGCIVRYRGVEHRVTKIRVFRVGVPWLEGNPKKKDGTFGTSHRNLYGDWEVVK